MGRVRIQPVRDSEAYSALACMTELNAGASKNIACPSACMLS